LIIAIGKITYLYLDEVGESDSNTAAVEFASFANIKLGIDIPPNIICNAHRIGTTIGLVTVLCLSNLVSTNTK
jgi:hypothetical protein